MNTANETQAMVVGGSSGIGYQTAKQLMPSTPPGVSAHPKTLPAPSAFFFPARQTGSPGPYGTLMAVLLPEGTETGTTEFGADQNGTYLSIRLSDLFWMSMFLNAVSGFGTWLHQ